MSENEINIAIAEEMGISNFCECKYDFGNDGSCCLACRGIKARSYTSDLNACAEFEATMDDKIYSDKLKSVIQDSPEWILGAVEARYRTAKATAPQRCEAFLRVKGKWKEASHKN